MFQKGQRITVVNGDFSYTGVVAEDTPLMSPTQTLRLEDEGTAESLARVQSTMKSLLDAVDVVTHAK